MLLTLVSDGQTQTKLKSENNFPNRVPRLEKSKAHNIYHLLSPSTTSFSSQSALNRPHTLTICLLFPPPIGCRSKYLLAPAPAGRICRKIKLQIIIIIIIIIHESKRIRNPRLPIARAVRINSINVQSSQYTTRGDALMRSGSVQINPRSARREKAFLVWMFTVYFSGQLGHPSVYHRLPAVCHPIVTISLPAASGGRTIKRNLV